ncbi:hypothetical protein IPO96_05095 [Candidatus Saccharibacteria bacterium]|jgi:hypothetical protein|nr:MAG: hypothetical protein IPO96_05095 [Candidatus Saccharibacteria bacterium]
MKRGHYPRNFKGLVMPPSPVESCEELIMQGTAPNHRRCFVSRHHLYWPRTLYEKDELSHEFREHPFNRVWMLDCQHGLIHKEYIGTRIPDAQTMAEFLKEADLLRTLGVSIRAVEGINNALEQSKVRRLNHSLDNRAHHLEVIRGITRTPIEIIHPQIAMPILRTALIHLNAA